MQESVRADQIIPVLVLSERELESGPEKLWDYLKYYVENDDVCIDDFTGILVVAPSSSLEVGSVPDDAPAPDLSRFSSVYHMVSSIIFEEGHELPAVRAIFPERAELTPSMATVPG